MGHTEQQGLLRPSTTTATAARVGGSAELGVAAAALRVGVAPSTLRAWERRYGLKPSSRTSGGHRRYSAGDLVGLQRMRTLIESGMSTASAAALHAATSRQGVWTPDPALPGSTEAERFADAVQAMTPARVSRAATRLLRERGAVAAWTQVFMPYLQALGQQWAQTAEAINEEHIAVAALQAALRAHAARRTAGSRDPQVLTAAGPEERHTLPLDALAAALADLGISSCALYDVPDAVLHAAVARCPDAVVVLWNRAGADLAPLRGLVGQAARVCAAGPGWRRTRLPEGVPLLTDLPSAVHTLQAMIATPAGTRSA